MGSNSWKSCSVRRDTGAIAASIKPSRAEGLPTAGGGATGVGGAGTGMAGLDTYGVGGGGADSVVSRGGPTMAAVDTAGVATALTAVVTRARGTLAPGAKTSSTPTNDTGSGSVDTTDTSVSAGSNADTTGSLAAAKAVGAVPTNSAGGAGGDSSEREKDTAGKARGPLAGGMMVMSCVDGAPCPGPEAHGVAATGVGAGDGRGGDTSTDKSVAAQEAGRARVSADAGGCGSSSGVRARGDVCGCRGVDTVTEGVGGGGGGGGVVGCCMRRLRDSRLRPRGASRGSEARLPKAPSAAAAAAAAAASLATASVERLRRAEPSAGGGGVGESKGANEWRTGGLLGVTMRVTLSLTDTTPDGSGSPGDTVSRLNGLCLNDSPSRGRGACDGGDDGCMRPDQVAVAELSAMFQSVVGADAEALLLSSPSLAVSPVVGATVTDAATDAAADAVADTAADPGGRSLEYLRGGTAIAVAGMSRRDSSVGSAQGSSGGRPSPTGAFTSIGTTELGCAVPQATVIWIWELVVLADPARDTSDIRNISS